jgi:hypothetical protein
MTVEATKPVPVTTITREAVPTTSVVGLIAEIVGTGFEAMTGIDMAVEVPPPGAGFTAVRDRLPAAATSAAARATLI